MRGAKFIELTAIEKFSDRCVKLVNIDHIVLVEPLVDAQPGHRCLIYLTSGKTLYVDGTLDRIAAHLTL
jgi:hypothetical protein